MSPPVESQVGLGFHGMAVRSRETAPHVFFVLISTHPSAFLEQSSVQLRPAAASTIGQQNCPALKDRVRDGEISLQKVSKMLAVKV